MVFFFISSLFTGKLIDFFELNTISNSNSNLIERVHLLLQVKDIFNKICCYALLINNNNNNNNVNNKNSRQAEKCKDPSFEV